MPTRYLNTFSHKEVEEALEGKPPRLVAAAHHFLQSAQEHADAAAIARLIPCMGAGLKSLLGAGPGNENIEKALREMQDMRREIEKEMAGREDALQAAREDLNDVFIQIMTEQEDEADFSKRADIDDHLHRLYGDGEKIDGAYFIKDSRLPAFLRDGLLKNFEGELFAMEARPGHVAFRLAGKGKAVEDADLKSGVENDGAAQASEPPVTAENYRDRYGASELYRKTAGKLNELSFQAAKEDFKNCSAEVLAAAGSVIKEAGCLAHIAAEAERFHGINLALVEILGANYGSESSREETKHLRELRFEIERAKADRISGLRKARAAFKKVVARAAAEEMTKDLINVNRVRFKRGDDGQEAEGGYFARAEDVERALREYFRPDPVAEVLDVEIRPGRVIFRLTSNERADS